MSTSPHHGRNPITSGATNDEHGGEVSRRAMLAGAVAAVAAVGASDIPAYAHAADPNSRQDMMAFLLLSAALTGIHVVNLAPEFSQDKNKPDLLDADPGVDPINIKKDYFNWVNASHTATFERMLQIAKDHRQSSKDIIDKVNASDDTKFLGRSIVLMWYLGSWYKPEDLKSNSAPGARALIPSEVISAKAYTQGLIWQIAQAHPMGYSNLQFGYWSRVPVDPNEKNSPLGFITATIP